MTFSRAIFVTCYLGDQFGSLGRSPKESGSRVRGTKGVTPSNHHGVLGDDDGLHLQTQRFRDGSDVCQPEREGRYSIHIQMNISIL